MTIDNPARLIEFIRDDFPSDDHVFEEDGKWTVTDEWLVGTFAGRGFVGGTLDDAARQMIGYLGRHVGHDSVVGRIVTQSGWPDGEAVKACIEEVAEKGDGDGK